MPRTDKQIIEDLKDVECQLSPENLSCDGELTQSQIRTRQARLLRRQKQLHEELGRVPTDVELWESDYVGPGGHVDGMSAGPR